MKRIIKAVTALGLALGIVSAMVAPAGAASESLNWLHVNNPGVYCGYAYALVNASQPAPGSAFTFAEGVAEIKANNPCAFSYGSGQSYPANYLTVQASLRCRWAGGPETVAWNSPTVGNTAGTGFVHVINGGTTNPCQDPDHLGLEERVVVTTQFYIIPAGYLTYTDTTHWKAA